MVFILTILADAYILTIQVVLMFEFRKPNLMGEKKGHQSIKCKKAVLYFSSEN